MATKHKPRKTKSEWQRIIEAQRSSGLTIKQYCSDNHLTISNFYLWQRKLRNATEVPSEVSSQGNGDWVPITIQSAANNSATSWDIELVLPGDVILKLRST